MSDERLVMAYADPPYIGQAAKHYADHPDYAGEVDHAQLIDRLVDEYPDGWALSLSSPSLFAVQSLLAERGLYPLDPATRRGGDYRVMVWVKPFAAFKRNVRIAYAWEPVLVRPARRVEGALPTRDFTVVRTADLHAHERDFVATAITMKRGLTGAKPEAFCHWLFAAMGLRRTDQLDDLFPGSGAVARAWDSWCAQMDVAA